MLKRILNPGKRRLLPAVLSALIVATGLATGLAAGDAAAGEKPQLTDGAVKAAVEDQFVFDSAVPLSDIDVSVDDGVVTLTGSVDNLLAKERALEIAEIVRGVRAVVNRIEVDPPVDLPGREVRLNVKKALLFDPATEAYEVSVTADDGGVVTLRGTVDSWHEKQLCGTVAKGAAGVTAVSNDIVVSYKVDRSDAEIEPEIEKRLRWDILVDHALINVEVRDGEVSLSGIVASAAEKRRAKWDAWVAGVKSVDVSGLNVERWVRDEDLRADKYRFQTDEDVRNAVEDALLYDPRVLSSDVAPKVESGVVTLDGRVDNLKAKRAAEMDARNTVGVVDVKNRIKIRPVSVLTDPKIAQNVRQSLLFDPIVERFEVSVKVIGGVVHLYGTVDTFFEKMHAEEVAYGAAGVVRVRNHLDVSLDEPYTQSPYVYPYWEYRYPLNTRLFLFPANDDDQIAEDIRQELWWSPYVNDDDIDVEVHDGVATLTGTVDTQKEYEAARNNAYEGGAVRVINKLEVE